MSHRTNVQKYDSVSIALHWIIGIGILAVGGIELLRHEFPRGHLIREGLKFIHQPAGTILLALIVVRIAWRLSAARVPASEQTGASALVAKLVHLALYGLMLALPLLGLVYVFGSGKTIDFGLFTLALPMKEALGAIAKPSRELHEALGTGLLVLALVHAAAALGHHYILKDGLLSRMGIRQRPTGRAYSEEELVAGE